MTKNIKKRIPNNDENELQSIQHLKIKPKELFLIDEHKNLTLDELITLIKNIDESKYSYNFNVSKIRNILEPLKKLKSLIGLDNIKNQIVNQILYFLQCFETHNDMLHTIIQGPSGVGKTTIAMIIGDIYYNMGILKTKSIKKNNKIINLDDLFDISYNLKNNVKKKTHPFKKVTRVDLVAGFVGQTALKTQEVIDSCNGGVLFIDEAYALGSIENSSNDFGKEAIDTIVSNLTDKKNSFLCIIAGYMEDLNKLFFSQNEGLARRFPFIYTIEKYTPVELFKIFCKNLTEDNHWFIDKSITEDFFITNNRYFKNQGGDIETLIFLCKINYGKRSFCKNIINKKCISIDDLLNAFIEFKNLHKNDHDNEYSFNTLLYI